MDDATFKSKVLKLFELELLKRVSDECDKRFVRVETVSKLSKLIYEGKFKGKLISMKINS